METKPQRLRTKLGATMIANGLQANARPNAKPLLTGLPFRRSGNEVDCDDRQSEGRDCAGCVRTLVGLPRFLSLLIAEFDARAPQASRIVFGRAFFGQNSPLFLKCIGQRQPVYLTSTVHESFGSL